jgi:transcriptional regulator with XRE-family HTH domain
MTMGRRNDLLKAFLRQCRARIEPTDVGLPDRKRRRTPGLRRNDVATLAGVSVTWYTWLEQGRDIQVSAEVLDRIAATLRLSGIEREYLFALAQNRAPPRTHWRDAEASPAIRRMLDAIGVPAIALTARWDVIAWNRLATAILRDYARIPREKRNLLRILLVDDTLYPEDSARFETMARRLIAKFRVDYSQYPDDPGFRQIIDELTLESPVFSRLWAGADVLGFSEAVVEYPQPGVILEHTSYVPEAYPILRILIYSPFDAATSRKIEAVRRQLADAES